MATTTGRNITVGIMMMTTMTRVPRSKLRSKRSFAIVRPFQQRAQHIRVGAPYP